MKILFLFLFLLSISCATFAEAEKYPLPSPEEVKAATTSIKGIFSNEYKNQKSSEERKALSAKLLEQAADASNSPAMVCALIAEAVKIAGQAGDVETAVEASRLLTERFEGENLCPERYKILKSVEASKAKLAPESYAVLAEEYLKFADECIASEDFDDALQLAKDAALISKKAKNTGLASNANEKKGDVEDAIRAFKELSPAIDKLKTAPDDPSANFAVGKYKCLIKGDWNEGLKMLLKSSNSEYKTAAELDLAAKDSLSILKAADKWWELAESVKDKFQSAGIKSRASELYQKILPELSGIEKVKAEKRMESTHCEKGTKLVLKKWITPMGGKFDAKGNEFILSGEGQGDASNAVAILDQPLPKQCTITGELKRTGPWSGFVVGYDAKAKTFLGIYSENNSGSASVGTHNNLARKPCGAWGSYALTFPPVDTYAKFIIQVAAKSVTIQIEKSKIKIEFPPEVDGNRFGILIYRGSTMQVRNLSIK